MRSYKQLSIPGSVWRNPWHFVAFGFGSGTVPFAPGTFGTLMAIPFYLALSTFSPLIYLTLVILIFFGASWLCEKVSREISVHDHPGMCIDEFVGFLVTMFYAPQGIIWIIWGVIFFRIFDILKPWPINYMDKNIKGGFGMVLDDVMAGIYSFILLHVISWIF